MATPKKQKNKTDRISLINGDSIDCLKTKYSNSIDSLVTDPPAGIAFMGKSWDEDKGGRDAWIEWISKIFKEAMRVMKPGAHGFVWALPRTSHWTATALENAGFEIRDVVTHVFGCLSEDSEVLTTDGWKRWDELKSLEVLSFDLNKKTFLFERPEEKYIYDYDDTAYSLESDKTDQIVSRNHRCIVERSGNDIFKFAEALQSKESVPFLESLSDLPDTIPCKNKRTGIEKQMLLQSVWGDFGRKDLSNEKEKKAYLSRVQEAIQSKKPYFLLKSKILFKRLLWIIKKKRSPSLFKNEENSVERPCGLDKKVNGFISEKDEGLEKSCVERRCNFQEKQGELYRTKIPSLPKEVSLDGTQGRLCDGASDKNGNKTETNPLEDGSGSPHRSQYEEQPDIELDAIQEQQRAQTIRRTRVEVKKIKYKGKVWCVKTSTGAFVARRNGKIFITGNSGFPKNHDVSKSLDKQFGAKRKVIWSKKKLQSYGLKNNNCYGADIDRGGIQEITSPSTPEAKKWDGFGTALKPASEHWILVKKPLSEKTVAKNFLRHGAGGVNVDASRIGTKGATKRSHQSKTKTATGWSTGHEVEELNAGRFPSNFVLSHSPECELKGEKKVKGSFLNHECNSETKSGHMVGKKKQKRIGFASKDGTETVEDWNCVDSCPVKLLDEQSGEVRSAGNYPSDSSTENKIYGKRKGVQGQLYSDRGGPSRFFYCAKPSKRERNAGLDSSELVWENSAWEKLGLNLLTGNINQRVRDTSDDILKAGSKWSTDIYGHSISEQYPKGMISTISTVIKLIIELKTLNASQSSNIKEYIQDAIRTIEENGLSLAESVEPLNQLDLNTIEEKTASLLGVVRALCPMLLTIRKNALTGNFHSTIKSKKLMSYLITMITPPNGVVLDPFMGSGSTGVAAIESGFRFLGIEKEKEYFEIAKKRVRIKPTKNTRGTK